MKLRQFADFFPDVVQRTDKIVLIEALERAVGRKCPVKLAKQPFIVQDEAELLLLAFFLEQAINRRDRLQQIVW